LRWNDPRVGIQWPIEGEPVMAEKDKAGKSLSNIDAYA
jgi:dTDP-4-dehydrorhamnose 3,5-epimerase